MPSLILLALAGLAGQLIDGALGMAFGLTSTTVLLAVGLAPAVASASTHLAEVGTTLASGISHWRFGNIDWPKIGWLAVPGAISAFAGATFLTSIPAKAAAPIVAVILFGMGGYILIRFAFTRSGVVRERHIPRWFLSPLAVVAGFMDAAGGGGWARSAPRPCWLRAGWSRARSSAPWPRPSSSSPSVPAPASCWG